MSTNRLSRRSSTFNGPMNGAGADLRLRALSMQTFVALKRGAAFLRILRDTLRALHRFRLFLHALFRTNRRAT